MVLKVHYRYHKSRTIGSYTESTESSSYQHTIYLKSTSMLSHHLQLGLVTSIFPLSTQTKFSLQFCFSHVCYMFCLSHPPGINCPEI